MSTPVRISEMVLRDAHQSLHATRMTTEDMLPICDKLDRVGYWSLEAWGGATYDACIRFLNEDPWERLRALKSRLPKTPIMMLLRGQNLLGYRHYADDVVDAFVEAAARNGVDVFRIFDALNDPRNLSQAARAAKKTGKHVQMAISYATTPYHTAEKYVELAKEYARFGADSICIKDMSGLLTPYGAYDLVSAIKKSVDLPVELHTHATTGMSVATLVKAAEAGVDVIDTAIASMSMGTSHSPTETLVEILRHTGRDSGLDINLLLEIAAYFRQVRKCYAQFESSFLGADTRILVSQVPGGMLSNLENQLSEQGALDKMDQVLKEIPLVQKDCGYIPLVTPTSQIVGTQSVLNVLFGRYHRLTAETRRLLTGQYGRTPASCDAGLVERALKEEKLSQSLVCRPADALPHELDRMRSEARAAGAQDTIEDVLTYAMFPKIAPTFFASRAQGPISFRGKGQGQKQKGESAGSVASYVATVNGTAYTVVQEGAVLRVNGTPYTVRVEAGPSVASGTSQGTVTTAKVGACTTLPAPVAGSVVKHTVQDGATVNSGETVLMVESMKMELEVKATAAGTIHFLIAPGAHVSAGQVLAEIR